MFSYKKRAKNAVKPNNRSTMLSMIIDGMDQNHCRVPNLQETTFGKPITQHLTGVLVHGKGIV